MGNKDKKLARIWREIYKIFMNDWDPVGVLGIPEAKDEYDSYIEGLYKLLSSGASENILYDYLYNIETETMGLPGNGATIKKVVKKLKQIDFKKM